jgi:hypothetical protein
MPLQRDSELDDTLERWDFELRLTQEYLPEDPTTAWSWSRRIEAEVAAEMQHHPEAEAVLAPLHSEVQRLVEQTRAASRKFLDDSARREHDFTQREKGVFDRPLPQLRKPWHQ